MVSTLYPELLFKFLRIWRVQNKNGSELSAMSILELCYRGNICAGVFNTEYRELMLGERRDSIREEIEGLGIFG